MTIYNKLQLKIDRYLEEYKYYISHYDETPMIIENIDISKKNELMLMDHLMYGSQSFDIDENENEVIVKVKDIFEFIKNNDINIYRPYSYKDTCQGGDYPEPEFYEKIYKVADMQIEDKENRIFLIYKL